MNLKVCAPVPVRSGVFNETKITIDKALDEKPDLVELRFDYIDNASLITKDYAKSLVKLVQAHVPVIFTLRDESEGGRIKIEESERLKILTTLMEVKPKYLDIEMRSSKEILANLIDSATLNNVFLIFSHHNFEKTPPISDALPIIENFANELRERFKLNSSALNNCIFKAIFTARNFEDNLVPIQLCKSFSEKGLKIVSFCMGEQGALSRIACTKFGASFTFGSVEEATAPGQIEIKRLRAIYSILFE